MYEMNFHPGQRKNRANIHVIIICDYYIFLVDGCEGQLRTGSGCGAKVARGLFSPFSQDFSHFRSNRCDIMGYK